MPKQQEVFFMLNGQPVRAGAEETVLSVAKRAGVHIPTLCHLDSVTPYGACRLCVVEVFWDKRSKLVTSCIYMPYENDSVVTDSERVRRARRTIVELLLVRCPEVQLLQKLAAEYGVEKPRFAAEDASRPERCILCGLCVRVCAEAVGQHAIGYASRGVERIIATPFDSAPEECIGCGACVFVCPTGALHYEDIDGERIIAELKVRIPLVKCRACGTPFATEEHIERIQEQLNMSKELAETCPLCRATDHRSAMERVLGLRRSKFESTSKRKDLVETHRLEIPAFRNGGE